MPDIFQASDTPTRDQRFRDDVPVAEAVPPQSTPSPVEPYLSEQAKIPTAPPLRKPKRKTMHIFTSYNEMPEDITFENQQKGEKILVFIRRSFWTNVNWLFLSILLCIAPFVLVRFFPGIFNLLPVRFLIVGLLFYFLLVATHFFVNFITWYFNINLVTNLRIVDVDFEDLVYKNVAETKLSLVQDVSYTQTGVIRTVTNYGDVLIQTAGTLDNFDLKAIPEPERVVNIVEDLIGRGRGHV